MNENLVNVYLVYKFRKGQEDFYDSLQYLIEVITNNGTASISEDQKQILYRPNADFVGQERLRQGSWSVLTPEDISAFAGHSVPSVSINCTLTTKSDVMDYVFSINLWHVHQRSNKNVALMCRR